ncbi:hypothetical protein TRFO_39138 [Tritrichomonas foetus]|uniref:Uncharacterized protein n=1 Tax=Tritrichomonas foetus TaxID=1144522 RepID=A0A1J4J654_9EUKA|nr:hypothetical protein TRFO_39138 [Tritrichomonas foetus]|eukprot:OHS94694.1 hypothetical protein TRFO_39138 [Tritrichomonas foetus]
MEEGTPQEPQLTEQEPNEQAEQAEPQEQPEQPPTEENADQKEAEPNPEAQEEPNDNPQETQETAETPGPSEEPQTTEQQPETIQDETIHEGQIEGQIENHEETPQEGEEPQQQADNEESQQKEEVENNQQTEEQPQEETMNIQDADQPEGQPAEQAEEEQIAKQSEERTEDQIDSQLLDTNDSNLLNQFDGPVGTHLMNSGDFSPTEPDASNMDVDFSSPRRQAMKLNQTCPPGGLNNLGDDENTISITSPPLSCTRSPRGPRNPPFARTRPKTGRSAYRKPVYRSVDLSNTGNELNKLKERAKKEEPLNGVSIEQFQELLYVLNAERKNFAREKRFKEGLRYNKIINHVNDYYLRAQKLENQSREKEILAEKKAIFENDFTEFEKQSKELEKELIQKQKQQRETLLKNHQIELDELDGRWASDKKQRIYNRSTNHLIQLRRQMHFMLVQSRFAEAEEVQKLINLRTKEEMQNHHELMQKDFDEALIYLKNKQKNEVETFDEFARVALEKLRQDREKLKRGYLNKQLKLRMKEDIANDPDRLWVHGAMGRYEESNQISTRGAPISPSSKMTRAELGHFDADPLELPPLDNRRKPKTSKKESED